MLNRMYAELLFHNPAHVKPAIAGLVERGFDYEVHENMVDEGGPAVFMWVAALSELDEHAFFDWVQGVIGPFGGEEPFSCEVMEAGLADPQIMRRRSAYRAVTDGSAEVLEFRFE